MKAAKPYEDVVIALYRKDPSLAADMLNACLEDGEVDEFLLNLSRFAKSLSQGSKRTHAPIIHEKASPEIKQVVSVVESMGMRLTLVPARAQVGCA